MSISSHECVFFFSFFLSSFLPRLGDLSSNDGFVDMPEIGNAPQTPSQHGTYVGSTSPYNIGHDSSGSIHHFPHFTPEGIPVYAQSLGKTSS